MNPTLTTLIASLVAGTALTTSETVTDFTAEFINSVVDAVCPVADDCLKYRDMEHAMITQKLAEELPANAKSWGEKYPDQRKVIVERIEAFRSMKTTTTPEQ